MRGPTARTILTALAVAVAAPILTLAQQAVFRSSVELVAVDTQVLDRDGSPINSLGSKDFQVWINGQSRKVISADLIQYPLTVPRTLAPALFEEPDLVGVGNVPEIRGRVIVLVVDELSFSTQALPAVIQTARKFLAALPPDDVVGLYAYPLGPPRLDLTHYHNMLGVALSRLQGLRHNYSGEFVMSPSEAVDIAANDSFTFNTVFERECMKPEIGLNDRSTLGINLPVNTANSSGCIITDMNCGHRLRAEADAYVDYMESQSAESFSGLRDLLQHLSSITGPKTVVLLSAGLTTADRIGSRPDVSGMMAVAGKYAAAADATVYAMHVDNSFFDTYSPNAPPTHSNQCQSRPSDMYESQARDGQLSAFGLERLAAQAGGQYFRITSGTGELFFNRVLKETSAYYLLGVQPEGVDRDGRVHFIRVKSNAKNAVVRARQQVTIPKSSAR